jgi:ubiquinone/menaquinone biosynthesis C-methylase UbiE
MASGTGYGTDLFSRIDGASVVGVDLDADSVHAARAAYPAASARFSVASATALPFRDSSFRSIVSLETIEHIQDDRGYLAEVTRVLAPDGICVISTPNRAYWSQCASSIHSTFASTLPMNCGTLICGFFGRVSIYYQGFSDRYHSGDLRLLG